MYEFKKQTHGIEIKLGDEPLTVEIDPAGIMDGVNRTYNDILRIQKEIEASKEDDMTEIYTKFGEAVLKLIQIIFKDKAEQYVKYYEGNYTALFMNLVPFLHKVVFPMLTDYREEQTEILKEEYLGRRRREEEMKRKKEKLWT